MEDNEAVVNKNGIPRAKSCNNTQEKIKYEAIKRKAFNLNDAVKSLDLALGRLKRSKLNSRESSVCHTSSNSQVKRSMDMFIESQNMVTSNSNFAQRIENTSAVSMNFSHYELIRNLSYSDCRSEGEFSNKTCDSNLSPADLMLKDEQLEKYFRSVEKWSRKKIHVNKKVAKPQVDLPEE